MADLFKPTPFTSEAAMDRAIDAFAVWDDEEGMVTMVRTSFDQLVVTARSAFRVREASGVDTTNTQRIPSEGE